MKLKKIIMTICLCAVILSIGFICAATMQPDRPQLLRDLDVSISSATTQQINYQLRNSSDTLTRKLIRYITKDGDTFCFDDEGTLVSFRAANNSLTTQTTTFSIQRVSREYIDSLLSAYIPDLNEFNFNDPPISAEYGYDIMLYKNADTVCEDCIVLRLSFGGELRAFNISRSGINDPTEVDTAYFTTQLSSLLESTTDRIISYDVGYQKIDGVVVATYSVEFEDTHGGRYVNVYTVA